MNEPDDKQHSSLITRDEIIEGLISEANLEANPGSTRVAALKELHAILTLQEKQAAQEVEEWGPPVVMITIEETPSRKDAAKDDGEDPSLSD